MKKNVLCLLAVTCLTACSSSKEVKPSGKEVNEEEFREKVADVKYAKESHFNNGVKVSGTYSYESVFDDEHKDLNDKLTVKGSAQYNYSTMNGYVCTTSNLEVTHTHGGEDVKNSDDEEAAKYYLMANIMVSNNIHCLYDFFNLKDAYVKELFKNFTFYVNPTQIGDGFKEDNDNNYKALATFDKNGLLKEFKEYNDLTMTMNIDKSTVVSFQRIISYQVEFEYI